MSKKIYKILCILSIATLSISNNVLANNKNNEKKEVYIVKFLDNINADNEHKKVKNMGIIQKERLDYIFKGFIGEMSRTQVAMLSKNPNIEMIELDSKVTTYIEQSNPTWGIDRLDQRNLPLDLKYKYLSSGVGVNVYIVDTGIRSTHSEFVNRVLPGYSSILDGNGSNDCNGHGTHVAGTIGGTNYGVAKGVNIIPVRVLDCNGSGSSSSVVSGLNWIAKNKKGAAVVNMSLGGSPSSTIDRAVNNLLKTNVMVVVAAGNNNADACNLSPARVSGAITVGASNNLDGRASFSNQGSCLDIFAPGLEITSSYIISDSSFVIMSGTSMATPHVTGAIAKYLQKNPNASPATIQNYIKNNASKGLLSNISSNTSNNLLFTDQGE